MIKSPQGRLLTLEQEHKALVDYSKDLFAPEVPQPCRKDVFLVWNYCLQCLHENLPLVSKACVKWILIIVVPIEPSP